jgi:cation diffusion facilitator CzcD-associated flavoprotein CzcO
MRTDLRGEMGPVSMEHETLDVVVVGAGFGGLAALRKLRDELGCSVLLLEAASGPGGVWYWNGYPGARCDVESLQYTFGFSDELSQEWCWTERFAPQQEILSYLNHVVERFDLAKDIRFNTRLTSASFDEHNCRWSLETDSGGRCEARYLIMATGPLSTPYTPEFPGSEEFQGQIYHTGLWPHHPLDFQGKRVAIIGTGSSGVQASTAICDQVAHLYVMQRTAHHCVPARNRPLHPGEQDAVKTRYVELRAAWRATPGATAWRSLPTDEVVVSYDKSALEVSEAERRETFERAWTYGGTAIHRAYTDLLTSEQASLLANDFIREKIASIVKDPVTADLLTPRQYYGTKRLILESGYYEMFNRPNVTLVDVRSDPIERLTSMGVKTQNASYDVDMVIFATGYDALTGTLTRIDIQGRGGLLLREVWRDGPASYLGIMVAGFPNLFIVAGPQSPSVLANVIAANEYQVDWISDAIRHLESHGVDTMEPSPEAQIAWADLVAELGRNSIYTKGNSWYWGSNIDTKPKVFLPYINFPNYAAKCNQVAGAGYEGFILSSGTRDNLSLKAGAAEEV